MKNNFLRIMSLTVFLIFLALYYSSNAGIIDYQARNRTALTEEQIKMFEDDVKNNVEIDIKKYLDDKEEKYDNNVSKTNLSLSNVAYSLESLLYNINILSKSSLFNNK